MPEEAKANVHSRHGGKVVDVISGIDVQVVSIPKNKVAEKVRAYKGEAGVEFAEPDYIVKAIPPMSPYTPNDELYLRLGQWGIDKIQAPSAWDITKGSSTVVIAILDTGIDQNHEDLSPGKIVKNKNFTSSRTVDDKYGHGTHVAGIAAAITDNNKGVAGVGFNSSLMNVKVLGDTGWGLWSWVAKGITWAADNGAKVINMSLGGSIGSSTLEKAVNYAWDKGCVVVAAAGNESSSAPSYPAGYTNCIAVAATDQSDVKADFSNYGDWVDIAAPGVDILSTFPNHKNYFGNIFNYAYWGGTSMATPHVAGVAALVFATNSGLTNAQVRQKIVGSVDPATGFGPTSTIGRVNAYEAVVSP
jgi:thermitase